MYAGLLNFLLLGAATTLYGPALIYIARETNQAEANIGVLFVLHYSGFFASTISTNRLARRFEIRLTVALGCLLIALGELGLILLPFPFNLASALLIGFSAGTLEVSLNRLVEFLAVNAPAEALTRLHATFGLGAVAIPLVVAAAVWLGWNWRVAGAVLVALAIVNFIVVLRWHEFKVPHGVGIVWRGVPWRSVLFFVLLIAIYVGLETAVGGWATTFFVKLGQDPFLGQVATSFFFLTFTFGRLILASSSERLGYGRAVRLSNIIGAGVLLLTFFPQLALIGFGLAGVAFSTVFPTMLAWAARRHPGIRAQMASISIASAGAGGIVIPYAIGLGVGAFGAWSLTPLLIGATLIVSVLTLFEPLHGSLRRKLLAP
jgi:fucose permease